MIQTTRISSGPWAHAQGRALLVLTKDGFSSILSSSARFSGLLVDDEGGEHDLSHEAFYHKNAYSLFRPVGGMGCKDAAYTPLRGTKDVYSGGGIYLKYEADLNVGRLLIASKE